MDDWKNFNETSLPGKKIYPPLNMENITDADDTNGNLILKDFEIKNLGEYFNLCFQSDTLLLADVLDNFRNMCLEIY